MCHNTIVHRAETVVLKLRSPSKANAATLLPGHYLHPHHQVHLGRTCLFLARK